MAETNGGKVQIVFLVDVFFQQVGTKPQELEEICQRRCKAISLCVLRLLLHFNASVGHSNRKKTFSWGFKFFNSRILNFEYKRRRFYDLDSQSFDKFEEEFKERCENVYNSQETGSKQTCTGAKALSCSFTEILHDFNWITPDISSPFRSGKNDHLNDVLRKPTNLLFVVGDCPQDNNSDLLYFLGRKVDCTNEEVLMQEIFSNDLYEEFRNTCNLSFYWIDTGLWCLAQEKLDVLKEWSGCKLMTAVTKQLNGNMIPISSLTQDYGTVFTGNPLKFINSQNNLEPDSATANKPCDKTLVNCSQSELYNKVLQAAFSFSFGGIVQAFLRGRDLTGMDILSDAILSVPKRNGLLYGFLYFQGDERICHIKLTQIITEKRKQSPAANANSQQPCYLNVNVSKNNLANPKKSLSVAAVDNPLIPCQSMRSIDFCIEMDRKSESEATEQDCENAFYIKGVISRGSVPPTWLHPTKLYSCLECGEPPGKDCPADSYSLCSSGLLEQLLLLISTKGLNMVVEFRDPETCAPVIGLLQPVTSVCGILSVVKTGMLLMIEKLLLNQKSHGSTLILRDVTVISRDVTTNDVTNPPTIPVEVRENVQLPSTGLQIDPIVKRDSRQSNQNTGNTQETQKNNVSVSSKENILDSFVRNVVSKQQSKRKDGKELLLKLRDYYAKKQGRQAHERNEEITVNQALTRGRLCQDTSLKNKAASNQESNSKPEKREEPEAHMLSSGLDSELMDDMEIDENPRNITDIKTVDDFKACLEKGYQKCVNLDHSAVIFVTHAFAMIDHLKSSCQLNDVQDQIMTILKSCVLRDNKSIREMIQKREDVADKDKIVQEYKLQVYLRLELADKMEGLDEERLADEITEMLRAISFQKDPNYLSLFLKNSVITRYAGNLSELLRHVYDGLMQRPPKEILSPSQISSEEETPLKSRKISSVSSKSESVEETKNPRTLIRRHSVMGVPDKRREIVVPVKVKSYTNSSENERLSTSSGRKESSRKAPAPVKSVTPVKKVRRNLFRKDAEGEGRRMSPRKAQQMSASTSEKDKLSRRHSIASLSRPKKVNDTPVCKQVSKRMLCRQESARRRAKTATDVTVVGESPLKDQEVVRPFPRKSPRRRAATFYCSSSRTSLATTSTAAEQCSEDSTKSDSGNPSNEESKNSGSPSLSSRAAEKITVNGESSSCRRGFQRSFSLKQPASLVSDDVQVDEQFLDVFLDTNEATTSSLRPSRFPSNSITALTRRSKSSPSLSRSSHMASRQSPSDPKRPLNASKRFTSPVFKLQSREILDISIPLTPVLATTADIRSVQCPTSFDERNPPQECSPSPRAKRPTVSQNVPLGQLKLANQINDDDTDSDSVVGALPLLDRKRLLLSSAEASTYKTDLSSKNVEVFKKVEFIDDSTERVTMNETNGGCPNVMSAGGQTSGYETLKQNPDPDPLGTRELSEVFTSPVATKRRRVSSKREHTSGSVSPLNQILKQRKNHRNIPSGTSREVVKKHRSNRPSTETDAASSSYHDIDRKRNPVKIKFPLPMDCEFQGNKESSEDADFPNSCRTNVPLDCSSNETRSLEKMRSSSSQFDRNKLYVSPNSSRSCSLQPHFTPMTLSSRSLKHLEESPVLNHPSSQSYDSPTQQPSSLSRKWSERRSPLDTSRLTLCKRLRHDS